MKNTPKSSSCRVCTIAHRACKFGGVQETPMYSRGKGKEVAREAVKAESKVSEGRLTRAKSGMNLPVASMATPPDIQTDRSSSRALRDFEHEELDEVGDITDLLQELSPKSQITALNMVEISFRMQQNAARQVADEFRRIREDYSRQPRGRARIPVAPPPKETGKYHNTIPYEFDINSL